MALTHEAHDPHPVTGVIVAARLRPFWQQPMVLTIALSVLAVLALALAVRVFYRPTDHLVMTTGSFSGANYLLATRYLVPEAKEQHIELSLLETGGSEDTLRVLNEGRVQVAFANGGLGLNGLENVREIVPLFLTGVHLMMRREVYDEVMATGDLRSAVRGKTVSLSNLGSGTRIFALREFERLGINAGDYTEVARTVSFLTSPATVGAEIPDLVFASSVLPSPVAARLAQDFDYRLYPLDYVEAVRLDDKSVYPVTIPRGAYRFSPPVPERDVTTLGYRILLVAHKDTPDQAVAALARTVLETDFARFYDPPLTVRQFDLLPEFPRHPGALAYVAGREPLKLENLGYLIQIIIAGLVVVVALPLYFVVRDVAGRARNLRHPRSLREYIAAVSNLEAQAFALDESLPRSRGAFLTLRRHLNQLKLEAMDAYKSGTVADTDLMPAFLADVADLRQHLNAVLVQGGSAPSEFATQHVAPVAPPEPAGDRLPSPVTGAGPAVRAPVGVGLSGDS